MTQEVGPQPPSRTRAAMRRGVGTGRAAARRVHRWSRTPLGRIAIVVSTFVLLVVFFFALIGVPLVFRSTPIERVTLIDGNPPTQVDSPDFEAWAELATRVALEPGAGIEILNNGDAFFPRLWQDLRAALHSITVVNYYASEGRLADTLHAILAERARAGVRVFFVYDPVGSAGLDGGWRAPLDSAGVRVAAFRPLRWYRLDRANHRTHARSIVIDGRIGYTGGYGFDDRWSGAGRSTDEWRETNVRVIGPPVRQLQAVFLTHWAEAAGELLLGRALASADPDSAAPADSAASGSSSAGILFSAASPGSSAAERALAFSVAAAQRTLFIANAYFVPDDDFVRLLCASARRGVDVRVLTNGGKSDVPIAWLAGRHRYGELLACGVRIFEYQPTVLHAKTLVVDGAWCVIGTINFDNRSLAFNEEVSLLVHDARTGARMEADFEADLTFATEVLEPMFARRSLWQRLRERGADLVSRWL